MFLPPPSLSPCWRLRIIISRCQNNPQFYLICRSSRLARPSPARPSTCPVPHLPGSDLRGISPAWPLTCPALTDPQVPGALRLASPWLITQRISPSSFPRSLRWLTRTVSSWSFPRRLWCYLKVSVRVTSSVFWEYETLESVQGKTVPQ